MMIQAADFQEQHKNVNAMKEAFRTQRSMSTQYTYLCERMIDTDTHTH